MARSRASGRKSRSKYAFTIPIIALVVLASVYVLATNPFATSAKPALDYTFDINMARSNGTTIRYIVPTRAVGVAGGFWVNHTYDALGVNAHYPIYMDVPPNPYPGYSAVHVRSLVNRQFLLGDFFSVWGVSLGQNNTLNIPAANNYTWEMCLVTGQNQVPSFLWGQQSLSDGIHITLLYYKQGTVGCA
jgi:hypothetical protein